jgi:hypothetical protein
MESWITNHYNKPSCFVKIDKKAFGFMMEQIDHLLAVYPLPKIKAETLEILLCNDGTERFEVIKCSTGRGKYLTYQFWLPYPQITKNKVTDLEPFITYLFEGFLIALTPFGVPENEIRNVQTIVKNEIVGKEKYKYTPSRDELITEMTLAMLKEEYKNNPNVII